MKKLLAIVCVIALLCSALCACGNMTLIDTTYTFTEAAIMRYDGEQHVKIKSWCDYENSDMIQLTLEDGTVYLTHSSNVILISPAK